jgi:hypothetical protein
MLVYELQGLMRDSGAFLVRELRHGFGNVSRYVLRPSFGWIKFENPIDVLDLAIQDVLNSVLEVSVFLVSFSEVKFSVVEATNDVEISVNWTWKRAAHG